MLLQPPLIVFIGCQIIKRLMRPDVIISLIPFLQLSIKLFEMDLDVLHLIKLFPMHAVRPFDISLQLGRSRRDYEQADASNLTGLFKVFLKLGSPVDLDRPDERQALFPSNDN